MCRSAPLGMRVRKACEFERALFCGVEGTDGALLAWRRRAVPEASRIATGAGCTTARGAVVDDARKQKREI